MKFPMIIQDTSALFDSIFAVNLGQEVLAGTEEEREAEMTKFVGKFMNEEGYMMLNFDMDAGTCVVVPIEEWKQDMKTKSNPRKRKTHATTNHPLAHPLGTPDSSRPPRPPPALHRAGPSLAGPAGVDDAGRRPDRAVVGRAL